VSQPPRWDREVELAAPGGEAVLSLAESPTTGYRWRLVDVAPEVEVVDSRFTPATSGGLGRGGERCFTLRLRAAGTFALTAESARGVQPAGERVRITVTGTPPG
jgi:predicted secreted protein